MTTNDKPALMSAERLAQYRAMVDGFEPHPAREPALAAVAALLAHIDALTAGDVDAEAGRRLFYELNPHAHRDAWGASDPVVRERHDNAAARLYAAGCSDGGAKRECLRAERDHAVAEKDRVYREESRDRAEIARLTAELAETNAHVSALALVAANAERDLVAARAEGRGRNGRQRSP